MTASCECDATEHNCGYLIQSSSRFGHLEGLHFGTKAIVLESEAPLVAATVRNHALMLIIVAVRAQACLLRQALGSGGRGQCPGRGEDRPILCQMHAAGACASLWLVALVYRRSAWKWGSFSKKVCGSIFSRNSCKQPGMATFWNQPGVAKTGVAPVKPVRRRCLTFSLQVSLWVLRGLGLPGHWKECIMTS